MPHNMTDVVQSVGVVRVLKVSSFRMCMYVSLVILSLGLTYSKGKIGYEIRKKYLVDMNPAITLSLFLNTLMTLRILHFFRVEYSILI